MLDAKDQAETDRLLRQLTIRTKLQFSRKGLGDTAIQHRAWLDREMNSMVLSLEAKLLGVPSERIVVHACYPCDWWQAFRERWFPQWWLRRWPVKYERIDIDEQKFAAVCPHATAVSHEDHLRWLKQFE